MTRLTRCPLLPARSQPRECVVAEPDQRRETVLRLIRTARRQLALSVFRCDDAQILDELGAALERGVRVRLLLTRRAKGWKRNLKDLESELRAMGAETRRYAGGPAKYHAKYIVADDGPALVGSLNLTRKCLRRTCDFLVLTFDPGLIAGLRELFEADWREPDSSFPPNLPGRLIVGPERARPQVCSILQRARRRIRIIDPKLEDPAMLRLLAAKRAEGVRVEVLGRKKLHRLIPHGKLILIDSREAVIGSLSLSSASLDARREVAVTVEEPGCVRQLNGFFEHLASAGAHWPLQPLAA